MKKGGIWQDRKLNEILKTEKERKRGCTSNSFNTPIAEKMNLQMIKKRDTKAI